jgi:hypothetical protein
MRYELRVNAYDMLDQVCVTALCYETRGFPETPTSLVLALTEQSRGQGTDTPAEWVRDALLLLLEAL